jgi:two-component system response regulator AtoC
VIEADVRIVAATNRDPQEALASGKLREDLYYRLNAFAIRLPPLRERPQDLRLLARHFLERYAAAAGTTVPTIDAEAFERLAAHDWPGNVRELKNVIERAALLSRGETIAVEHLPPELATVEPSVARSAAARSGEATLETVEVPVGATLADAEREMIRTTLRHTEGNKTRAARILAISPKTMHNKVKKYGL